MCSRALRSKILFNGSPPIAARSLLLARTSSQSVAEATRTDPMPADMYQLAADGSRLSPSAELPGFTFDDGKNAYRSKTSWEIVRALTVFRLCSFDFLINRNKQVSRSSYVKTGTPSS